MLFHVSNDYPLRLLRPREAPKVGEEEKRKSRERVPYRRAVGLAAEQNATAGGKNEKITPAKTVIP